jgi:hypothetical protein
VLITSWNPVDDRSPSWQLHFHDESGRIITIAFFLDFVIGGAMEASRMIGTS